MSSPPSSSVLKWEDEFDSVETNAENKALIEKLYQKEKQLMQLENKCESNKEEIQVMTDLFQNFKRELKNTGVICCAKERERELERHLKTLEERETSRLVQDSTKMRDERRSVAERKTTFESHKLKAQQQLETFKTQMTWNQMTMDAFLEESAKIDEETMAIIKYAQQEEQRIKSLTSNIDKTRQEANDNHRALDKEMTETLSTQIALDKTMDSLQQVHQDRRQLIHLWENTINQRKCRDAEMQHCALKLARFNQEFRQKNDTMKERKHVLETQRKDNREPEKEIFLATQQAVQLQQDLKEHERNCSRLQDELYCGKGALNKATADLTYARSHVSSMKKDTQDNEDKLKKAADKNAELEEKLRDATETSLNEEQRALQIQQLLKDQEQDIKKLDSQMSDKRVEMINQKQRRQDLREEEKASLTRISRSKCHICSQGSQLHKLDRERNNEERILKQLESIVAQQNEQQVQLPDGVRTEEREMAEKKIAELTDALEEKKRMDNMLTNLLRECEGGTRLLRKEKARSEAQNRDLKAKVEHLQLLSEANDKELKNVQFQKQDTMVEYNIMKFEIKRFRDLLYNEADNVLTLESRKLKLQRDIAEREEKDNVCRETLSKHIKISEEERKKLSVELNEKLAKVDMLKSRFEILAISMAAPEGKEEKSQIYYIIKAVQEKEEIKRMGDRLDVKIHEVERQNKEMENSVQLFSDRNTAFRNTINSVTKSSVEHQERLRLEEQLRAAEETHKYKRRQIQVLQQDFQDLSNSMEDSLQDENPEKENEGHKLSLIRKLNKEMDSKREKTVRAKTQCSKMTKAIRSAKGTKTETAEEKMVKLRQSRGSDKSFNNMLREIMGAHSGLRPVLEEHFQQANLPLPSCCVTPLSRLSS